jgi:hypothetical protein
MIFAASASEPPVDSTHARSLCCGEVNAVVAIPQHYPRSATVVNNKMLTLDNGRPKMLRLPVAPQGLTENFRLPFWPPLGQTEPVSSRQRPKLAPATNEVLREAFSRHRALAAFGRFLGIDRTGPCKWAKQGFSWDQRCCLAMFWDVPVGLLESEESAPQLRVALAQKKFRRGSRAPQDMVGTATEPHKAPGEVAAFRPVSPPRRPAALPQTATGCHPVCAKCAEKCAGGAVASGGRHGHGPLTFATKAKEL